MIKNRKIENVQWIRCDIDTSNTKERLKATINDKVCIVPKDPLNSDYEEILEVDEYTHNKGCRVNAISRNTGSAVGFSKTTKDRFSGDNSTTGFTMSQTI